MSASHRYPNDDREINEPRSLTGLGYTQPGERTDHTSVTSASQTRLASLRIPQMKEALVDSESDFPRSTSATSSLDPYYFSIPSRQEPPAPPLPRNSSTNELLNSREPSTPSRDPASIDRNGLVGVGELLTPRWPKAHSPEESFPRLQSSTREDELRFEEDGKDASDSDDRGSPWTIEAVDGEQDDYERLMEKVNPEQARYSRTHRAIPDESGGEEIVYPRKPLRVEINNESTIESHRHVEDIHEEPSPSVPKSPPTSFVSPARKAKKRSSDEFALDQSGFLIPKVSSNASDSSNPQGREKEELAPLRKHHSLAVGTSTSSIPPRDRRRGGSVRISAVSTSKSGLGQTRTGKHLRHQSASSASSNPADIVNQRLSNSDSNSVPPSPSSAYTSRRVSSPSVKTSSEKLLLLKEKDIHSSPNVAHSLLRGTQEGWSALDDDETAEALRKLDGIYGKGSRSRGSVGPASRLSNNSRPSTPGTSKGNRMDGTEGVDKMHRMNSIGATSGRVKERHRPDSSLISDREGQARTHDEEDRKGPSKGSPSTKPYDDQHTPSTLLDSDTKLVSGARLSFTPKRGSASSTNYTGTPTSSSRESAILSAATSATSASVNSNRLSFIKARRNSAGSDISSIHSGDASSHRDRVLASGESADGASVPPVPPLPKDLSSYKTPPQSSTSLVFPASDHTPEGEKDSEKDLPSQASLHEVPRPDRPVELSSGNPSFLVQGASGTPPTQPTLKTPSKKWSFTNPLNMRRSASPGRRESSALKSPSGRAHRSATSSKQLRPSSSKESTILPTLSPKSSVEAWQNIQRGAMASETSLASLSSLSSLPEPSPPISPSQAFGAFPSRREENQSPSRSATASSFSATHTSPFESQLSQDSPTSKVPREPSNKRLTPSSIPFFRRSSSQSMQIPPSSATTGMSTSPTFSSAPNVHHSGLRSDIITAKDPSSSSPTTPGFSQRKSSMLSLGLPSILKGSGSRKSVHVEKNTSGSRENGKANKGKDSESEGTKSRKDDKDRSESRISVLMGRKRGKTLSSTDQKKIKPIALPPMQVTALPQATTERIAQVKPYGTSTSSPSGASRLVATSSRLTSQTISSMQKQSDASLRSTRQQLPTIAGSPSVGLHSTNGMQNHLKDSKDQSFSVQAPSLSGSMSGAPKETPTRIPRIASRSSTVTSPALKNSSSLLTSRRTSLNAGAAGMQSDPGVPSAEEYMDEFGVLDNVEEASKSNIPSTTYRQSFRSSPTAPPRGARQSSGNPASASSAFTTPRKPVHDAVTVKGLRKSSTGSVSSMASTAGVEPQHSVMSALSPSKGLNKLLSPKMSLPGSRLSGSSTTPNIFQQQPGGSPTFKRQSLSTPSPVPSSVDEDELLGDEEMMQYIRRTQARKLAHGAKKDDLDDLLKFPEPLPPGRSCSPTSVLNSDRLPHLSDYERKEILDYSSIYYIGNKNDKKPSTRDVSANNYGYDDDRGDYQVINHDHLAYRYEIIDTLGKGSFGQVLHCRDYCTGESVAIKIIRNKKRFHHQALVEIKILENLRKWDPEERHHVIKMTEHFYFRNHLCIAMELLSINLYELIKANGFAGFSTTLIRRFTSQMLLSLSLMRHHRIVHCDLKPENILLRHPAKSGLKVIDFGSSCLEHEKVYTYIQSRFYRSPEVILGMNYNMAIDMWSLGCILAELYTGYPIFPGENEQEQLSCIMEVLGVPDKELVNRSSRKRLFFDSTGLPRPVVNSKGRRRRAGTKSLAQVLRCDDELFIDFVSKCLCWDPERRIKPQSAMRHPFVTAGRRAKLINNPTPSSSRGHLTPSSSLLNVGRNKPTETPKKSQISAPTPLAARSARAPATQIPSTPNTTLAQANQSSSKSFRSSHASYHSGRSTNGFAIASAK